MKKYNLITTLLMTTSFSGYAAEFCATTPSELQSALSNAENNSEHDVIKITTGSFVTPGSAFSYDEENGFNLTLSGGWSLVHGNPCGQQLVLNRLTTVLDGNSENRVMRLFPSQSANIHISNLFFINGDATDGPGSPPGGGLSISALGDVYTGRVTIENNAFIGNKAARSSALSLYQANTITVKNNWFVANHATEGYTVDFIQANENGIYFINNTVYSNTVDSNYGGGVFINVSGSSQSLFANNLLWGNDNNDLYLGGNGDHRLLYNDIGILQAPAPSLIETGNFSLPPRFETTGFFNYTPTAISPLVNKGTYQCNPFCSNPPPFEQLWSIGVIDAEGNVRDQQGRVDIGAVESPYMPDLIFMNGLD